MAEKSFMYSSKSLFGEKTIIGYGTPDFHIREVDRKIAKDFVIKNHYSKKIFNNSYIHLGCFINNNMLGVLQYGHMLNNAANVKIVRDTKPGEGIELNRMVFLDEAERNTESRAISYSIKYIKHKYKSVKWIQSFADERCGRFGVVYQAANFGYYGEHMGDFYEHNGEIFHEIALTKDPKKAGKRGAMLRPIKDKLKKLKLRQFRYIYFIDRREINKCLLSQKPYPKHYTQEWEKVIMLNDCPVKDDEFYCPICLIKYEDCQHPGPMQDDEYLYKIKNGELYALKIA